MLGLLGQPAQLAAEDALTVVQTLAMALYTGARGTGWGGSGGGAPSRSCRSY